MPGKALHLGAGIGLAILAWLLPRRVARARWRNLPALALDALPVALLWGLLLVATARPLFAGFVALALIGGLALADRVKRDTLREPVVVADRRRRRPRLGRGMDACPRTGARRRRRAAAPARPVRRSARRQRAPRSDRELVRLRHHSAPGARPPARPGRGAGGVAAPAGAGRAGRAGAVRIVL